MTGRWPAPQASVAFIVNGREHHWHGDPVRRLADVLRDDLGLTGTKIGCNAGDCGACTVLIDGAEACACLVPVGQCGKARITTVEGLAAGGRLDRLQAAFHAHGAAQCGICTPGMLMAAHGLLARCPAPTRPEVEDALGGVLCRCTGYAKIVAAVMAASDLPRPALSRGEGRGEGQPRVREGQPRVREGRPPALQSVAAPHPDPLPIM
jgi:aerobic-type carbon monoxide dehydrogenase small subunit (CoxS/CutS family)